MSKKAKTTKTETKPYWQKTPEELCKAFAARIKSRFPRIPATVGTFQSTTDTPYAVVRDALIILRVEEDGTPVLDDHKCQYFSDFVIQGDGHCYDAVFFTASLTLDSDRQDHVSIPMLGRWIIIPMPQKCYEPNFTE